MATQVGLPAVSELLSKSLAEEEISDSLLTQIARELMSEARTGDTKAPKRGKATRSTNQTEAGRGSQTGKQTSKA
jgi:hypothetical protein